VQTYRTNVEKAERIVEMMSGVSGMTGMTEISGMTGISGGESLTDKRYMMGSMYMRDMPSVMGIKNITIFTDVRSRYTRIPACMDPIYPALIRPTYPTHPIHPTYPRIITPDTPDIPGSYPHDIPAIPVLSHPIYPALIRTTYPTYPIYPTYPSPQIRIK